MARINANVDVPTDSTDDLLQILDNLSRDIGNVEGRAERLQEHGIELDLKRKDGEITVSLKQATEDTNA